MQEYEQLKRRLGSGWNTWNVRSVLSHVWLGPTPDETNDDCGGDIRGGFAVNLGLLSYQDHAYLKETLPGREDVRFGAHSGDGSYTDLTLRWNDIELRIESAHDGPDMVLLATPKRNQQRNASLVIEGGMLWNRPGCVQRVGDTLVGHAGDQTVSVYPTATPIEEPNIPAQAAYLVLPLDMEVGISSGRRRTLNEIKAALITRRAQHHHHRTQFVKFGEVYEAVQTPIAWNTIYDPAADRVISPASRLESLSAGGWALHGWQTFFAALMAAVEGKDLAYANAIEMVNEMVWEHDADEPASGVKLGFVPSSSSTFGIVTQDCSHPPIGSYVFLDLYRRFGEKWPLEMVFDSLLAWNRWWADRRDNDGLLAWGCHSAVESGMDGSPMFDDARFDDDKHMLALGDAGLNAMYIWDCDCLCAIARAIGRREESELRARADRYRGHYSRFWSEEDGFYYNRRLDTNQLDRRSSPASFYALLGRIPSRDQAARIASQHLYDGDEFWGEWVLPSISKNDPAFGDGEGWRGRIWPPMNFLVYVGLQNYDLPEARLDLATKSEALLMREWRKHRHVHKSYSATTGDGCDLPGADPCYHWGGLLGLIALMQAGY